MRLLIAGWKGQVARAMVEMAPAAPDVTACAVGRAAVDICEARTIERAMVANGPDVVINSAAYTAVDKAEDEGEQAFRMNRDGARQLAEATAKAGIPMIHISTDYVFDGSKSGAYSEDDEPSPVTVYGQSRLEGEQAVLAANPKAIIVRTAWIHSAAGKNFVKSMLELATEQDSVNVVDDQTGSPTYAPHLCSALLEIARQVKDQPADASIWGIYHAAGSGETTWHGLAKEVMKCSAKHGGPHVPVQAIHSEDYPTRAKRPANAVLDCSKLQRTFNIALPAWEDGAEACVKRLLE